MTQAMVGLQGLHMSDAFRCSNILASMGLKSFCPWCLKFGGTPKWSLSTLERCITGWLLCVTCACHLLAWTQRAYWSTILDVKPSTRNAPSRRDRKKGKKFTQEKIEVPGMKGDILITQLGGHQGFTEWNATQHLLSSPVIGCKLVHFLNLSGSSWLHCSGESSFSQTNCLFFLQSQCL